jgi:hypothetical protein
VRRFIQERYASCGVASGIDDTLFGCSQLCGQWPVAGAARRLNLTENRRFDSLSNLSSAIVKQQSFERNRTAN